MQTRLPLDRHRKAMRDLYSLGATNPGSWQNGPRELRGCKSWPRRRIFSNLGKGATFIENRLTPLPQDDDTWEADMGGNRLPNRWLYRGRMARSSNWESSGSTERC